MMGSFILVSVFRKMILVDPAHAMIRIHFKSSTDNPMHVLSQQAIASKPPSNSKQGETTEGSYGRSRRIFPARAVGMDKQDKQTGVDDLVRYQQLMSQVHEDRQAMAAGRASRDADAAVRLSEHSPIRGAFNHHDGSSGTLSVDWNRSRRVN